jgi:hypothetical protein
MTMSAIDNLKSKKWHELTNAETVVIFYYDQYSENDGDKAIAEQAAAELARLQAIEAAVRERTKNAIGLFNSGHGKKYAYCNDCRAIGATLEPDSIKHNRGCLVAALAPTQPGDDEKG